MNAKGQTIISDPAKNRVWEIVVVKAAKYIVEIGTLLEDGKFARSIDQGEKHLDIIREMVVRLPLPVIYVILQLLVRMSLYVTLEETAFEDDEDPVYPKAKCDLDFTLKQIWKFWRQRVERSAREFDEVNPYTRVFSFLSNLIEVMSLRFNDEPYKLEKGETFEQVDKALLSAA